MRIMITFLGFFLTATAAHAAIFTYECTPASGNATDQTIRINGNKLAVSSSDSLNGKNFSAVYDASYQPKNGAQKVRFISRTNGSNRDVILYSRMLEGTKMGYVQIRGNEDGYWSAEYKCFLR